MILKSGRKKKKRDLQDYIRYIQEEKDFSIEFTEREPYVVNSSTYGSGTGF